MLQRRDPWKLFHIWLIEVFQLIVKMIMEGKSLTNHFVSLLQMCLIA